MQGERWKRKNWQHACKGCAPMRSSGTRGNSQMISASCRDVASPVARLKVISRMRGWYESGKSSSPTSRSNCARTTDAHPKPSRFVIIAALSVLIIAILSGVIMADHPLVAPKHLNRPCYMAAIPLFVNRATCNVLVKGWKVQHLLGGGPERCRCKSTNVMQLQKCMHAS